jgi:hypothetical protein
MTKREASGEAGLFDGGVGKDWDGADGDIRASNEGEWGPSTTRCARM